jgi:hypothetical protein
LNTHVIKLFLNKSEIIVAWPKICYPIIDEEKGELQTKPEEGAKYCQAPGTYAINPQDLSND